MSQSQLSPYGLATTQSSSSATGYGYADAHHGEILQGLLADSSGRLRRALVSLICDVMTSEASFRPDPGGEVVTVTPAWKTKAQCATKLTLAHLKVKRMGGELKVESTIPLGWGLGSSTSDVTAAIRATASALGQRLGARTIAQIAVGAERASDALMFGNQAVLFAHRDGAVIEDFGGPLPPLHVLGFNTDPTGVGIDTLTYAPARYTWWEIEAFRPLVGLMRQAVQAQSRQLVGRVATASARINQRYLPKPAFDGIERMAEDTGALGIQVAHSGTVAGLLFDPYDPDMPQRIEVARALLGEIGFGPTWEFQSGGLVGAE